MMCIQRCLFNKYNIMNKKTINLISILVLVFIFVNTNKINAQNNYNEIVNQDSIVISYKLKSKPNTKHKGPLKLDLRIENKDDKSKEISFVIDLFQNAIIFASSEKQTYCISPNMIMFGDKKYSSFDISEFKIEDINEESLLIDISELEIKDTDVCN
jgi:hypothetical protein